ncbi:MAG: hypothetical protein ACYC6W_09965 [Nitrosotalea sp.]
MKPITLGAIGGGAAVAIALVVIFVFSTPTAQYSMYVDPRTESGDGLSESHVTIINTGSSPLTNLKVDYGNGHIDKIPLLNPKDKIILSPPALSKTVIITTDQGITVTKPFEQISE